MEKRVKDNNTLIVFKLLRKIFWFLEKSSFSKTIMLISKMPLFRKKVPTVEVVEQIGPGNTKSSRQIAEDSVIFCIKGHKAIRKEKNMTRHLHFLRQYLGRSLLTLFVSGLVLFYLLKPQQLLTLHKLQENPIENGISLDELHTRFQLRLHNLQNLQNRDLGNCSSLRVLICRLHGCVTGFACQIHHIACCFLWAYATNRTLVLPQSSSDVKQRIRRRHTELFDTWSNYLQPIALEGNQSSAKIEHCLARQSEDNDQIIYYNDTHCAAPFTHFSIPSELNEALSAVGHANHQAWFLAEFVQWIMRLSSEMKIYQASRKRDIGFEPIKNSPIIGLHVRRTDKLEPFYFHGFPGEAKLFDLKEYLKPVKDWFSKWESANKVTLKTKRIFIATEEPGVIEEAKSKYGREFEFLGNVEIAKISRDLFQRGKNDQIRGIISDINLLTQCDFVVCTFTSNVGRLVFELMQKNHRNASEVVVSLDEKHHWEGLNIYEQINQSDAFEYPKYDKLMNNLVL